MYPPFSSVPPLFTVKQYKRRLARRGTPHLQISSTYQPFFKCTSQVPFTSALILLTSVPTLHKCPPLRFYKCPPPVSVPAKLVCPPLFGRSAEAERTRGHLFHPYV